MRLSIVIPSCLRVDLLTLCLRSLQRHATRTAEVIVVDDASLEGIVTHAASKFAGVKVVQLQRRTGFCGAVNAGITAANGDIVELLNDDAEVMPGWADAALRWFADPKVGAVAPLVLRGPAGDRIDSAGDRYFIGGVAAKRHNGERPTAARRQAGLVFGASGSSAFYRRDALVRVGAFPDSFGAYFEDVDVAFRLQRAGFCTIFEPASQVLHRVSASHGRPRRRLLEQQSCNEERVFWRNLPPRDLLRALPWHAAVLAGKAARRWREGTLTPWLCGRLRVLAEVPDLVEHRRQLAMWGKARSAEEWKVETRYWGEVSNEATQRKFASAKLAAHTAQA